MLIEIEPALKDQRFGLGDIDVTRLILSTRLPRRTLFPVSEWPSYVYVARIVDDTVLDTGMFTRGQVELIAWGTLFRTREEAWDLARRL